MSFLAEKRPVHGEHLVLRLERACFNLVLVVGFTWNVGGSSFDSNVGPWLARSRSPDPFLSKDKQLVSCFIAR